MAISTFETLFPSPPPPARHPPVGAGGTRLPPLTASRLACAWRRLEGTSRGATDAWRGDAGECGQVKSGFLFPILLRMSATMSQALRQDGPGLEEVHKKG